MGTNYYLTERNPPKPCPTCGVARERVHLHIGKSSAGWCFALHVYPEMEGESLAPGNLYTPISAYTYPQDWVDWEYLLYRAEFHVVDEYGREVPPADMTNVVTVRGQEDTSSMEGPPPYDYKSWPDFMRANSCAPGPNGLWRHKVGRSCIAHGEGTWDLVEGDFS